jgi:hypothetical protein
MVDNINPNSQFHPYQKPDAMPNSERPTGGLSGGLGSLGNSLKNMNWQQPLGKVRAYANAKPGMALGTLAALAIGAGLLRGRR